ncbi:MAG: 6-bladed beta-propeller [Prevotellaceae bacterium]|jgi:hypothetical protein|nr:6-bladed beta-propeller [Prevotellaceae bacterium]
MKKIQHLKYQIILLLFLSGCVNSGIEKDRDTLTVRFDFTTEPVDIHGTGLIDDVEVLNLDCKESIFANVDRIIRYRNRIYLMDKGQTRSVFIYDTSGNFVSEISKYGQGPDEYIQLTDIVIDTLNATLNLISRMDRKMLKYDLDGKHFHSVERLPKSFSQFSKTGYGYVGYMENYGEEPKKAYNVWTVSQELKLEHRFFPIDPTWESKIMGGPSAFSTYKNNLYCAMPLDFNIYKIDRDTLFIPYSFDLGKAGFPSQYGKGYEQIDNIRKENHYILDFYHFQETDNHLIIHTLYSGQNLLGVYNKNTSKSYVARLEAYTGKYFFSFGRIIGIDEKAIYALVDASSMKTAWEGKNEYNDFRTQYPEQIKRFREKFSNIDEEGNPFLVIYSIN